MATGQARLRDDLKEALAAETLAPSQLRRTALALAWPSVLDNVLQSLVNMVALIMVGHLSPAAIAAVGASNQVMNLALTVFMALAIGTTALVARHVGAEDQKGADLVTRQSLWVSIALGLGVGAVGVALARPILTALGADADVMRYGLPFLRISLGTIVLASIGIMVSAALRGAGDMRTPLAINVIANVANFGFLWVLINGHLGFPAMGVAGAALGTALTRLLSTVMYLSRLIPGRSRVQVSLSKGIGLDFGVMGRLFRVGMPSAIEQAFMQFGMLVFIKLVIGLGTKVYAAHMIGTNVTALAFQPGIGLGTACATMIGQGLGAKRPDRAELFARETVKMAFFLMTGVAATYFAFSGLIVRVYTQDLAVIATGALILKMSALVQPGNSVGNVLSGGLRGAGDTKWPMYVTILCLYAIRLPVTYLVVQYLHFGIVGIWAAIFLDMNFRAFLIGRRFLGGRWKEVAV